MYTEEPRKRIDWPYVLRKIIIIVLIVLLIFLIIWLINRGIKNNKVKNNYNNNNIKENIKNNNDNNNNGNLSNPEYYSESFITNYMYFHDNARDFVEKNNLPIENNSVTYTLQELIDKGILLPTSYGNNSCDTENSYVVVTNDAGKYNMTTTLICGKEIAKTNEELKCSELCTNCNVVVEDECKDKDCNTAIEYEFKQAYKATDTIYNCPSGYTKTGSGNNTKCVKNDSNVVNPTKNTTYTCQEGYTKTGSGNNTKCVKNTSETVKAIENTTYTCSNGAKPNSNHMCPVTSTSYTKEAKVTYSCSDGSTPNSNHMCPVTSTSYKCDDGDLVNTSYCRIYTTGSYYTSYNSYYGKTYNSCTYTGSSTTPCTNCAGSTRTVYTYKCYKSSYRDVPAAPISNTVYTNQANVTYSCSNGSTPNSNHMCSETTTIYEKANSNTTYSCKTGTLKDKLCIVSNNTTINPNINVSYNCPVGYTKQGLAATSICTKGNVITVNPTKSTKEVTKYRTKWSTETSIPGWTKTGKTRTVKAS